MQFERAITRHGMPLYVFNMPHVTSVAAGVLVRAGTRDEQWPEQAGLAHAFEHMVFQGNSRVKNSKEISEEIEVHGGVVNAWTWKEMTFYPRIVPDHVFDVAIKSLASQVTTPLFRARDIKKEMKNVVEEIKRAEDNPSQFCGRIISEVVYGDHPIGKDTLGTIESVTSFRKSDFVDWQENLYHSGNYVFLVVGNVTIERALEVINRVSFGKKRGDRNNRAIVSEINQDKNMKIVERDIKQANIRFGVAIGAGSDTDTKALDLYESMMSGGMSFPLFQEVRDKRGLCYSVGAMIIPWSDRGIFQLYIGTDSSKIKEAIKCIKDVVWKNRANKALFEKAKGLLLGRNAIKFSSPGAIINQAAVETIFSGEPKSPEEIAEDIRSVELSDVTSAVERYLAPDNFSYAYVVPKGTKISE